MTRQAEDELFVTIRNDKGEPVCTVERAVAERLGWLKEQGDLPPEKTTPSATEARRGLSSLSGHPKAGTSSGAPQGALERDSRDSPSGVP